MKELEKRMYFFVPYNISPIQQAIQAGHAALEYARKYQDDEEYQDFVDNWKTWIILNGGTTNSQRDFSAIPKGSLNQILDSLTGDEIKRSFFMEPDLNDALTAVCFIADERVFNYEDYLDFPDYLYSLDFPDDSPEKFLLYKTMTQEERKEKFSAHYKLWVRDIMGGEKNAFLRELLKGKKLA